MDKFTVSTSNGNGVLTYPIGLLTADEATFSGFAWFDSSSSKSYLKDANLWWTMSPALVSANYSYIIVAYSMLDNVQTAFTTSTANMTSGCVKPSISLKPSIKIVSGTGSKEDPFTVNAN